MEPVRLGIVGLGGMGRSHAANALAMPDTVHLIGGTDPLPDARRAAAALGTPTVDTVDALLDQGVEAIIVASPHTHHEPTVVRAAERGVHVLCEKPIAAAPGAADRMVETCRRHDVILAIDFQRRAVPVYRTLRRLLITDTIGEIGRVAVTATGWYRTQAYYDSATWRGTWEGEGGGVLMNQAAHDLDSYVWLSGLPLRVKATTSTRIHRIETENTAAALYEHEGGRVDTFITSTAEVPGKTEWLFVGDRGTVVCDGRSLRVFRLRESLRHHALTAPQHATPEGEWEDVPPDAVPPEETGHAGVLRNFAMAVRGTAEPIATGEDGVKQLDLACATLLAGQRNRPVEVPVNRADYDELLQELRQREV